MSDEEFKYNNRNLTNIEIINEFFICYNFVYDFDIYGIEKVLIFSIMKILQALFDKSSVEESD